jgi:hypothetical protein
LDFFGVFIWIFGFLDFCICSGRIKKVYWHLLGILVLYLINYLGDLFLIQRRLINELIDKLGNTKTQIKQIEKHVWDKIFPNKISVCLITV